MRSIVQWFTGHSRLLMFWLMAALAVPVWVQFDSSAWDLRIYGTALTSLQAGHDPYVDATTIQKLHHVKVVANGGVETDSAPPYSYVYSPITLPALRVLDNIPRGLLILFYWGTYVIGVCAVLSVCVSFSTGQERAGMLYTAGVAPFFPGLLANGTVLSGNVAYILYGTAFATAWVGWRKALWWPFYVAVLASSCVKAPLLTLALIPALSARRQWFPSLAAMAAGVIFFAGQSLIWPALFRHYLEAVELQFSLNHDFGCSPAGLFSQLLYAHGIPYSTVSSFVYTIFAVPTACLLVYLSRRFLRGDFPLEQWAPVMLTGIILLNPRIMEYDVAPVTLAMALIAWRWVRTLAASRPPLQALGALFLILNAASLYSWEWRKVLDGPLLTALFFGGCWYLARRIRPDEPIPLQTPIHHMHTAAV